MDSGRILTSFLFGSVVLTVLVSVTLLDEEEPADFLNIIHSTLGNEAPKIPVEEPQQTQGVSLSRILYQHLDAAYGADNSRSPPLLDELFTPKESILKSLSAASDTLLSFSSSLSDSPTFGVDVFHSHRFMPNLTGPYPFIGVIERYQRPADPFFMQYQLGPSSGLTKAIPGDWVMTFRDETPGPLDHCQHLFLPHTQWIACAYHTLSDSSTTTEVNESIDRGTQARSHGHGLPQLRRWIRVYRFTRTRQPAERPNQPDRQPAQQDAAQDLNDSTNNLTTSTTSDSLENNTRKNLTAMDESDYWQSHNVEFEMINGDKTGDEWRIEHTQSDYHVSGQHPITALSLLPGEGKTGKNGDNEVVVAFSLNEDTLPFRTLRAIYQNGMLQWRAGPAPAPLKPNGAVRSTVSLHHYRQASHPQYRHHDSVLVGADSLWDPETGHMGFAASIYALKSTQVGKEKKGLKSSNDGGGMGENLKGAVPATAEVAGSSQEGEVEADPYYFSRRPIVQHYFKPNWKGAGYSNRHEKNEKKKEKEESEKTEEEKEREKEEKERENENEKRKEETKRPRRVSSLAGYHPFHTRQIITGSSASYNALALTALPFVTTIDALEQHHPIEIVNLAPGTTFSATAIDSRATTLVIVDNRNDVIVLERTRSRRAAQSDAYNDYHQIPSQDQGQDNSELSNGDHRHQQNMKPPQQHASPPGSSNSQQAESKPQNSDQQTPNQSPQDPTQDPTHNPTQDPTHNPTQDPTHNPTQRPRGEQQEQDKRLPNPQQAEQHWEQEGHEGGGGGRQKQGVPGWEVAMELVFPRHFKKLGVLRVAVVDGSDITATRLTAQKEHMSRQGTSHTDTTSGTSTSTPSNTASASSLASGMASISNARGKDGSRDGKDGSKDGSIAPDATFIVVLFENGVLATFDISKGLGWSGEGADPVGVVHHVLEDLLLLPDILFFHIGELIFAAMVAIFFLTMPQAHTWNRWLLRMFGINVPPTANQAPPQPQPAVQLPQPDPQGPAQADQPAPASQPQPQPQQAEPQTHQPILDQPTQSLSSRSQAAQGPGSPVAMQSSGAAEEAARLRELEHQLELDGLAEIDRESEMPWRS